MNIIEKTIQAFEELGFIGYISENRSPVYKEATLLYRIHGPFYQLQGGGAGKDGRYTLVEILVRFNMKKKGIVAFMFDEEVTQMEDIKTKRIITIAEQIFKTLPNVS